MAGRVLRHLLWQLVERSLQVGGVIGKVQELCASLWLQEQVSSTLHCVRVFVEALAAWNVRMGRGR